MLILAGLFFEFSIPKVGSANDETNTKTWVISPSWHIADSWQVNVGAVGAIPIPPASGSVDIWNFLYGVGGMGLFSAIVRIIITKWKSRGWRKKTEKLWHFLVYAISINWIKK